MSVTFTRHRHNICADQFQLGCAGWLPQIPPKSASHSANNAEYVSDSVKPAEPSVSIQRIAFGALGLVFIAIALFTLCLQITQVANAWSTQMTSLNASDLARVFLGR